MYKHIGLVIFNIGSYLRNSMDVLLKVHEIQ
jgi:hypothetical protein